jgi:hypothetical protein
MIKMSRRSERGSALMLVVIIVIIMIGISLAYQTISFWNQKRQFQEESGLQAMYIAESAANQYVNWLNSPAGTTNPSAQGKTFLNGGYYWVPLENVVLLGSSNSANPGSPGSTNFYSFQVGANFGGATRRIDVIISKSSAGAFNKVIDAENQKGGAYEFDMAAGDVIRGNAYIAGDINAQGTAQLLDAAGSKGNVTKYTGNNMSALTGNNPPTFVQGKEDPLDLSPDPTTGRTHWEQDAINDRNTLNHVDAGNGNKYIDVAYEINTNGSTNTWVDGSSATDIRNRSNPAHIFRKDPTSSYSSGNRTQVYEWTSGKTAKSDYYLEDPTSTQVTQTSLNGTAHPVNGDTTASMINIQNNGNNAVYFIDGNMRVSGEPIKSYQLDPDASVQGPVKMTVIVKGNVSLTDNVLLPSWMSQTDGMAIVAIEDPAYPNVDASAFAPLSGSAKLTPNGVSIDQFVSAYNAKAQQAINAQLNFQLLDLKNNPGDLERAAQEYNKIYGSGNVFFGDPGSGTVEHFESFLYAQNNFYATNLDSTKSSGGTNKLEIYGNMAAGNKIMINRNTKTAGYIPLNLTFDPLISNGGNLPDLPKPKSSSTNPWTIQSWKQSANTAETGGDLK